jgi:membrane protein CcdC involved in cytochrome C biogenesis
MMPKWRKATWAIAIWTGIHAVFLAVIVVVIVVTPRGTPGSEDIVLVPFFMTFEWILGMLVLGPIWLVSRPKG